MKKAFTLIEVLMVIGIIAIVAGIVVLAINPNQQLENPNEALQSSDIFTIHDAINQYVIDNGEIPSTIPTDENGLVEICATVDTLLCLESGLVDLSALTTGGEYLEFLPVDPEGHSVNGIGYQIGVLETGRIMIAAGDGDISISR